MVPSRDAAGVVLVSALALMNETDDAATLHDAKFGSYPMSLDELAIATLPDGGNRELLNEIGFQSDGETMTVEWGAFRVTRSTSEDSAPVVH